MSKSAVLSLIVTAAVIGLIAWSMRGVQQVRCDVCVTFKGETVCRTGVGRTQEDAQRSAATAACAVLPTSSMAERIRCSEGEPTSVVCD